MATEEAGQGERWGDGVRPLRQHRPFADRVICRREGNAKSYSPELSLLLLTVAVITSSSVLVEARGRRAVVNNASRWRTQGLRNRRPPRRCSPRSYHAPVHARQGPEKRSPVTYFNPPAASPLLFRIGDAGISGRGLFYWCRV